MRPSPSQTTVLLFYRRPFIVMILMTFAIAMISATSPSTAAFVSVVTTSSKRASIPSGKSISMKYQNQMQRNSLSLPVTTTAFQRKTASTQLQLGNDSNSNSNIDVDGMQTAPYIFTFILLLCVWNFTIPTEFRRARICSEQQVIDYPDSNCKTWSQYVSGIQDYYRDGGSLFKFDFSIDRENNIWITGPQEIVE